MIVALACAFAASRVESVEAFRTPRATGVAGLVTDVVGSPISDAEVSLRGESKAGAGPTTRTGVDGRFSLTYDGTGSVVLTVRRLGFRPYSRSLLSDTLAASRPLRIVLVAMPLALDTVRVEVIEAGRMREFYQRKRIHASGHFLERSEIEARRPAYSSDLLRTFPGFTVRPSPRGGNIVRIRGCRPSLWIDGIQAINAELDEIARPSEIAGVEAYSSAATIPPQYRDRSGRDCGAIFIWTRIN